MVQNIEIGKKNKKGFTLIEILIVITVIGIIAAVTRPAYQGFVLKSKESTLKKNLYILRDAIDAFSVDNRDKNNMPRYPKDLSELVEKKYIRYIPEDPFTENDRWGIVSSDKSKNDVYDIYSLSNEVGTNGKPYSEW